MVTGVSTEQCSETITRVAADLGYNVDFVTEATRTFPITHEEEWAKQSIRSRPTGRTGEPLYAGAT